MSEAVTAPSLKQAQRWLAWSVAVSAVVYVGYGVWSGVAQTSDALRTFRWPLYGVVLATTLGNYGVRYLRWVYLLSRVDITLPHRKNVPIFAIGLAMTLSPGKAGEVLKPYLLHRAVGAPLTNSIPALVAERVTDAIAILALALIGLSLAGARTGVVSHGLTLASVLGALVLGTLLLTVAPLGHAALDILARIPLVGRLTPALRRSYAALRDCLSPTSLLLTLSLSTAAWMLECVGTWLVLQGFGVTASLAQCTFVYAFSTALGAISPGGIGVTDAALIELGQRLLHASMGVAAAAALLIRVATLWFGVLLGAAALLRVERLLADPDHAA